MTAPFSPDPGQIPTRARAIGRHGVDSAVVDVVAARGSGAGVQILGGEHREETTDRLRAAFQRSGLAWPRQQVTVNLAAHASIGQDLAIAAAVMAHCGHIPEQVLDGAVFIGDLTFDGSVPATRGVLPAVLAAQRAGVSTAIVPMANVDEARLVDRIRIHGTSDLLALAESARTGRFASTRPRHRPGTAGRISTSAEFLGLQGDSWTRLALTVAAAGGHHILLTGRSGSGASVLAEGLSALLPDLEPEQAIEVTALHSLAGLVDPNRPLLTRPPLITPHYSASRQQMLGNDRRPGAATTAHLGVLMLEGAPEFHPGVLESLSRSLTTGQVNLTSPEGSVSVPARFQLAATAKPCPCGSGPGSPDCTCSANSTGRYRRRLGVLGSGLGIRVAIGPHSLLEQGTPLSEVRATVEEVRARQTRRWGATEGPGISGWIDEQTLRRHWPPDPVASSFLDDAVAAGRLDRSGADQVLRVAWTLADLDGSSLPGSTDVRTALHLHTGANEDGRTPEAHRNHALRAEPPIDDEPGVSAPPTSERRRPPKGRAR